MDGSNLEKGVVNELMRKIRCDEEKDALVSSNSEYKLHSNPKNAFCCIRKIPDVIREQNKNAYNPSMVSIGPLHRGKGHDHHLHAMEAVKFRYMTCLLNRDPIGPQEAVLSRCVGAVSKLEALAREWYAEEIILSSGEFAEMMVVDACFIIELLLRSHLYDPDPILLNSFRYTGIKHDLLLLENQIPFFILQELFNLTVEIYFHSGLRLHHHDSPSLIECVHSFFGDMVGEAGKDTAKKEEAAAAKDAQNVYHILHLLHRRYVQPSQLLKNASEKEEDSSRTCIQIWNCILQTSHEHKHSSDDDTRKEETWKDFKYSATELDMAGVKLLAATAASGNRKHLFDVKFSIDGRRRRRCSCFSRARFEIPPFLVDDITGPLLRNLIAFEQTSLGIGRYFTSHAILMDKLINSTEDVKLLEEAGIICNSLGSREEVFLLFNNISNNISVKHLCLEEPCIQVNKYCKQRWPKFLVKLRRDYFSSPWTIISIIAAFILFVLTLLQTIYALLSYY